MCMPQAVEGHETAGALLSSVKDLKIVQDHENIVAAISHKDASGARELMETHLSRYKTDAAAIRDKYPQYFK